MKESYRRQRSRALKADPLTLLRAERLGYLRQLVQAGPDALLALIRFDAAYLGELRSAMHWLHSRLLGGHVQFSRLRGWVKGLLLSRCSDCLGMCSTVKLVCPPLHRRRPVHLAWLAGVRFLFFEIIARGASDTDTGLWKKKIIHDGSLIS